MTINEFPSSDIYEILFVLNIFTKGEKFNIEEKSIESGNFVYKFLISKLIHIGPYSYFMNSLFV